MICVIGKNLKRFAGCFISVVFLMLCTCSCVIGSAQTRELAKLSDNLLSDYSAQFDYCVSCEDDTEVEVVGSAIINRSQGKVTLSILSPSPFGGICVTYSAQSIPHSVTVTYEGISTEMPTEAFDRINTAMALFTDDFALGMKTLKNENVTEEKGSEYKCVRTEYNGSLVDVRYDTGSFIPVAFTVTRGQTVINAAATKFKAADAAQ